MKRAVVLMLSAAVLSAEAATLIPKPVVKPVRRRRPAQVTNVI